MIGTKINLDQESEIHLQMTSETMCDSDDDLIEKDSTLWTVKEVMRNEWYEYAVVRKPNVYSLVGSKNEIDKIIMFIESLQCYGHQNN